MTNPTAGISRNLRCALFAPSPGSSLGRRYPLVTAQGVEVVAAGKRRWVDPHWCRGNSYFRIGWDWLKAALENG